MGQGRVEVNQGFRHANATFVQPRLAVGGDLSPNYKRARRQLSELIENGITHIVDLRSEWTDEDLVTLWAPEIRYLHHPVDDAGQVIEHAWFESVVTWISQALAEPDTKVLVHCHMGVNRAPSVAYAVLLDQGVDLREALNLIRGARPVAVIDYATDALNWHLTRTEADARARRNARRRLKRWRSTNQIDAAKVIRAIRETEVRTNRWLLRVIDAEAEAITDLLSAHDDVTVEFSIDDASDALSQFDEVLLMTGPWFRGRGLVMGPPYRDRGAVLMPVLVNQWFDPVRTIPPRRMARWIAGEGPNLRSFSDEDFQRFRLA